MNWKHCALGRTRIGDERNESLLGRYVERRSYQFLGEIQSRRNRYPASALYGRPYGKSLCHAWGASPIYLLGKYYLGVKPTKPGYEEYSVTPCLGGLKWMEGTVPTPYGNIHIYMDKKEIRIKSDGGKGVLNIPTRKGMKAMTIEPGEEQVFKY